MSQRGYAVEERARKIASSLGVADFVFQAITQRKGSGVREISDGLICVGNTCIILQSKSRNPSSSQQESTERTKGWLDKNIGKACDQASGTRRALQRLQSQSVKIQLMPLRASEAPETIREKYLLSVDERLTRWFTVVVVDHPNANGYVPAHIDNTLFITLEDWRTLFVHLQSPSALIHYMERIQGERFHVPLGHEEERYRRYAQADIDSIPLGSSAHPILIHPDSFDRIGAALFRDIIHKIWPADGYIPWSDSDQYRSIVLWLDELPPTMKCGLGKWFLNKRQQLEDIGGPQSGRAEVAGKLLVYAADKATEWPDRDTWALAIQALARLRHSEAYVAHSPSRGSTLAIGCLVYDDTRGKTGVEYTFVLQSGPDDVLDDEAMRKIQAYWPPWRSNRRH